MGAKISHSLAMCLTLSLPLAFSLSLCLYHPLFLLLSLSLHPFVPSFPPSLFFRHEPCVIKQLGGAAEREREKGRRGREVMA